MTNEEKTNSTENTNAVTAGGYGFTAVELIIVILLIGLLAWSIFPLLRTSFEAWELADFRQEIIQIDRTGMSQLVRETRKAYDLAYASEDVYFDFVPIWATSVEYRFEWTATSQYYFNYGQSSPAFSTVALAYPVASFTYETYTRRMVPAATRARTINSLWFNLAVSDERRKLPAAVNPRYMRSMAQMRNAREGYFISKSSAFSTDSYYFDRSDCDRFCIKVFNDRLNVMTSPLQASASVTLRWSGGSTQATLTYYAAGDYDWFCCYVGAAACGNPACDVSQKKDVGVEIRLNDGLEQMIVDEQIEVDN